MLIDTQTTPLVETSLSHYFKERLNRFARRLRPPPQEDTCWYLGTILERLAHSEELFAWEDGHLTLRPLALLYSDAREAPDNRQRCLLLQQLGDTALFLGALFPERYARRGIRRDYFVGMGGGAYDYLADNAHRNRHVFAELAGSFNRMLELVARVCARTHQPSAADVLTLYRRWQRTRDPVAERQLRALGIDLEGAERLQ